VPVEVRCLAELLVAQLTLVVPLLVVLLRGKHNNTQASTKQIRWMGVGQDPCTYRFTDVPLEVRCRAELLVAQLTLVVQLLVVLRGRHTTTHSEHKATQMDVCEANAWLLPLTPHIHASQHTHVHTTVHIYTYHCADVLPEVMCLAELLVA
jgi:hypothetical protein